MQVSKHAAIGAAAAFLVLFGLVFFLLGRESTRTVPPAAPAPVVAAPVPVSVPAPAPVPVAAASPDAAAVRDYFAQLDAIQPTSLTGDTGEFANKLLAATMGGDSSGFDELVRAEETGAARARTLVAPPPCADYHRRMIAMLGESLAMTKRLAAAIATSDTATLGTIAAAATDLQSRATALEAEAAALKSKYGVR